LFRFFPRESSSKAFEEIVSIESVCIVIEEVASSIPAEFSSEIAEICSPA